MHNVTYGRRKVRRTHARAWISATARITAVILTGAIAARTVMLTIDTIAARNGSAPGGEIFLPIYAAMLLALGWYLRGAWNKRNKKG